jgi:alanine racemase
MHGCERAVAQINVWAVRENLTSIRRTVGRSVAICPVIKADGYGHGAALLLPALQAAGLGWVAVATLDEAVAVREAGWTGRLLLFGPWFAGMNASEAAATAEEAVRRAITCTINDNEDIVRLHHAARAAGRRTCVHLKIDTGMGRVGLRPDAAAGAVERLRACDELELEAVYTHFATSEALDTAATRRQLAVLHGCDGIGGVGWRHAANTGAIFRLPDTHLDMVRPGLGVYGYWPDAEQAPPVALRPCLRLVSRVQMVRELPAGHAVGYGQTFVTQRASRLGVVPIGYGDGYPRELSSRGVMTLRADSPQAVHVPVVGRVSMDQTVVDLTDVPNPQAGEPIVVIDDDPAAPNSVTAIARVLGTIPYCITCGLGNRVRRVVVDRSDDVDLTQDERYRLAPHRVSTEGTADEGVGRYVSNARQQR